MSASKKRQTMAKHARERAVKEKRALKLEKKRNAAELRLAEAHLASLPPEQREGEPVLEGDEPVLRAVPDNAESSDNSEPSTADSPVQEQSRNNGSREPDSRAAQLRRRSSGSRRLLASLRANLATARETEAIREIGFEIAIAVREVGAMLTNVGWEQAFALRRQPSPRRRRRRRAPARLARARDCAGGRVRPRAAGVRVARRRSGSR